VRTVSKRRLSSRLGAVLPSTLRSVSDVVRLLLDLP
jgi:mRNA-degrading endonuclease toxin of MazEF toxin-antitoxin module